MDLILSSDYRLPLIVVVGNFDSPQEKTNFSASGKASFNNNGRII